MCNFTAFSIANFANNVFTKGNKVLCSKNVQFLQPVQVIGFVLQLVNLYIMVESESKAPSISVSVQRSSIIVFESFVV